MTKSELGLILPDGSFKPDSQIKREMALDGDLPIFNTPLPNNPDFSYWSSRFRQRQEQYKETAEIQNDFIEVTLPEPSCINFFGDLHVGSADVNYQRIQQEVEVIANTPNSYVMLMGDLVDGYFFNPAQFSQVEQAPEQFQYAKSLIDYLASKNKILVGWIGDHDHWVKKMGGSAYTYFSEEAKAHLMQGVGYVKMNVGEQEYRLTGAHRLPGHSMYNTNHPGMRADKFGGARGSDIVVHGHTHRKGYAQQPVSEFGGESRSVSYISIGPYKSTDDYARKLGLSYLGEEHLFGSAIILHGDQKRVQYFDSILDANKEIVEKI